MYHKPPGTASDDERNLRMFILDVLRYDVESVETIVKLLNNPGSIGWRNIWPHDFTADEVTYALLGLATDGMVAALQEHDGPPRLEAASPAILQQAAEVGSLWFALTAKGRQAWEDWEPPPDYGSTRADSETT